MTTKAETVERVVLVMFVANGWDYDTAPTVAPEDWHNLTYRRVYEAALGCVHENIYDRMAAIAEAAGVSEWGWLRPLVAAHLNDDAGAGVCAARMTAAARRRREVAEVAEGVRQRELDGWLAAGRAAEGGAG